MHIHGRTECWEKQFGKEGTDLTRKSNDVWPCWHLSCISNMTPPFLYRFFLALRLLQLLAFFEVLFKFCKKFKITEARPLKNRSADITTAIHNLHPSKCPQLQQNAEF
jgi:hypothetical protein